MKALASNAFFWAACLVCFVSLVSALQITRSTKLTYLQPYSLQSDGIWKRGFIPYRFNAKPLPQNTVNPAGGGLLGLNSGRPLLIPGVSPGRPNAGHSFGVPGISDGTGGQRVKPPPGATESQAHSEDPSSSSKPGKGQDAVEAPSTRIQSQTSNQPKPTDVPEQTGRNGPSKSNFVPEDNSLDTHRPVSETASIMVGVGKTLLVLAAIITYEF
jgi:hypothetical protein